MGRPADGHDLRFNLHPFINQHHRLWTRGFGPRLGARLGHSIGSTVSLDSDGLFRGFALLFPRLPSGFVPSFPSDMFLLVFPGFPWVLKILFGAQPFVRDPQELVSIHGPQHGKTY